MKKIFFHIVKKFFFGILHVFIWYEGIIDKLLDKVMGSVWPPPKNYYVQFYVHSTEIWHFLVGIDNQGNHINLKAFKSHEKIWARETVKVLEALSTPDAIEVGSPLSIF